MGRSRGGRNTKIHALTDAKGRLIAILLTGGEAHDCPVADRLIRRVKSPARLLGYKAYDSAELREELDHRGTKPERFPTAATESSRSRFNKCLNKLRWRIHRNAFNRLKDFRANCNSIRQAGAKLPRLCLPCRCSCMVDLMSPDPSSAASVGRRSL